MKIDPKDSREAVRVFLAAIDGRQDCDRLQASLSREGKRGVAIRGAVGNHLIRQYQAETGEAGAIDWSKFRQWLDEHMSEINFARLLLSLLMLLLVFV